MPKRQPEQLFIAGTEPPPDPDRVPEVDDRLTAWLSAKDAQRDAADTRKQAEHLLMVELVERGIDRYPYVDPSSGKRRYFVNDKTPRAKTMAAPTLRDKSEKSDGVFAAAKRLRDVVQDAGAGMTVTIGGKKVAEIKQRKTNREIALERAEPTGRTRTRNGKRQIEVTES